MAAPKPTSDQRDSLKELTGLRLSRFYWIIIAIWLILVLLKVFFFEVPTATVVVADSTWAVARLLAQELLSSLIDTLPTFLLGAAVMRYVQQKEMTGQIERIILSALEDHSATACEALSSLSEGFRKSLISAGIETFLTHIGDPKQSETRAIALFEYAVEPYLRGVRNFRLDLHYEISVAPLDGHIPPTGPETLLSILNNHRAEYNWIRVRASYRQYNGVHNKKTNRIEVYFACDAHIVNSLFGRGEIFYRELMQVGDDLKKSLIIASKRDLRETFLGLFQVRFETPDGREVDVPVDVEAIGHDRQDAVYCVSIPAIADDGVAVSFRMPQLTSAREFLCTLPEPTLNPTIQLSVEGLPTARDLRFYSFFPAGTEKSRRVEDNVVRLAFKGWIFPRAGVLFTWRQ